MIKFLDVISDSPHLKFQSLYTKAVENNQTAIEAIAVSSFNPDNNSVDSRFVNLKYIQGNEWIFFSNYLSPKAKQFQAHDQVSVLIYWSAINTQIRIQAKIKQTSVHFSDEHFRNRSKEKNALAISSNQSQPIDSFEQVEKNYQIALKSTPCSTRPEYWGGFSFAPYYFEFWEGHSNRLNKRHVFEIQHDAWNEKFLQP